MMIDDMENVYNSNVLAAIIEIRGNKKRPDTKDIKEHVTKKFTADVEEMLVRGIIMELLLDMEWNNGKQIHSQSKLILCDQKKCYLRGSQFENPSSN